MTTPPWAERYSGLTFLAHGRDPRKGLDCWGLVRLALAEQFGVTVPSYGECYADPTDIKGLNALIAAEKTSWVEIPAGLERAGDVIVIRNKGYQSHVGIVLGDREMLHIERDIDAVVKDYGDSDVRHRVMGFYRHVDLAARDHTA